MIDPFMYVYCIKEIFYLTGPLVAGVYGGGGVPGACVWIIPVQYEGPR